MSCLLRERRLGYVLALSRSHLVPLDAGKTRVRADRVAADLPASAWQRRSASAGSKGPSFYDWAWLDDVCSDADPDDDGRRSLLIRRNTTTGDLAFYRCWTPKPATLTQLARVAGIRWTVEESFQAAKGQVGLDQHQARRWDSWRRFTTLALAALAVLAIWAADAATDSHRPQLDQADRRRDPPTDQRLHHPPHQQPRPPSPLVTMAPPPSLSPRSHYTHRLNPELQP